MKTLKSRIRSKVKECYENLPDRYKEEYWRGSYSLIPIKYFNKIVGVVAQMNKIIYIPSEKGVKIIYPDGSVRFINNSRYEGLEEDFGLGTREEEVEFTRELARINRARVGQFGHFLDKTRTNESHKGKAI